jgi:hypothetical protein
MTLFNKIVLGALIAFTLYTFWPRETTKEANIDHLGIEQNTNTNISIMGITIGSSSLQDAEKVLKERSNNAIFIPAKENRVQKIQLEAYFKENQIILGLEVNDDLLEKIKNNGVNPFVLPNGVVKVGVGKQESATVKTLLVNSLTLLSHNRVNLEQFEQRFGKAGQIIQTTDGNVHFLYPNLGLDLTRGAEGADALQFVEPKHFARLLDPLKDLLPPPQPTP